MEKKNRYMQKKKDDLFHWFWFLKGYNGRKAVSFSQHNCLLDTYFLPTIIIVKGNLYYFGMMFSLCCHIAGRMSLWGANTNPPWSKCKILTHHLSTCDNISSTSNWHKLTAMAHDKKFQILRSTNNFFFIKK